MPLRHDLRGRGKSEDRRQHECQEEVYNIVKGDTTRRARGRWEEDEDEDKHKERKEEVEARRSREKGGGKRKEQYKKEIEKQDEMND